MSDPIIVSVPENAWSVEAVLRLLSAGWMQRRAGGDGLGCWDKASAGRRLIQSTAIESDGKVWSHVSVSRHDHKMPSWEELRDVVWLLHPGEYAYVVIAPQAKHVNLREVAHAWCCLEGPQLPDFTRGAGTI